MWLGRQVAIALQGRATHKASLVSSAGDEPVTHFATTVPQEAPLGPKVTFFNSLVTDSILCRILDIVTATTTTCESLHKSAKKRETQ
jgi:hypothetical protein